MARKILKKFNLICIAHPDDETLFFGGLILRKRDLPWRVVCVTDANADGQGRRRRGQFRRACKMLGAAQFDWLEFPDIYEKRIVIPELIERLEALPRPANVFTHGIMGEYMHPHHQDVSYAVHRAFAKHPRVFSAAYNVFPDFRIQLTRAEYEKKSRILTRVYGSETTRFLNLLPATFTEGYYRGDAKEIEALYGFFARGEKLNAAKLKRHKWLAGYLKENSKRERPF